MATKTIPANSDLLILPRTSTDAGKALAIQNLSDTTQINIRPFRSTLNGDEVAAATDMILPPGQTVGGVFYPSTFTTSQETLVNSCWHAYNDSGADVDLQVNRL